MGQKKILSEKLVHNNYKNNRMVAIESISLSKTKSPDSSEVLSAVFLTASIIMCFRCNREINSLML